MGKSQTLGDAMKNRDFSITDRDAIPGGTRNNLTPERRKKMTKKERGEIMASIFPTVDCGETPIGPKIIIQKLKIPKEVRRGGIIRPIDAQDADQATVAVAKVVAIGPLAFLHDATGKSKYPGGKEPFKVGDYVRVPKIGGQHLCVEDVHFYYIYDEDVHGVITDIDRIASLY